MNITTQDLKKWRKEVNRREGSETLWRVRAGALIDQLLEVTEQRDRWSHHAGALEAQLSPRTKAAAREER